MSAQTTKLLGAVVLTILGAVASFVLTTVVMDQVPDVLLVGITASVGGIILVVLNVAGLAGVLTAPRRNVLGALGGGILAFWLAPFIVLIHRATDAPSGSEVLFFSTAAWGFIALMVGAAVLREMSVSVALGGGLLGLAGAAGLLANWERPSSFSPFAKFPVQEWYMLGAGLVFVLGTILILRAARGLAVRHIIATAAGAAGIVGALSAMSTVGEYVQTIVRLSTELTLLGVANAAFIWGWTNLVSSRGLTRSSSILLPIPAFVTLLFLLERATGIFGPLPFQIPGVWAGTAVCLAGAAAVWMVSDGTTESIESSTGVRLAEAVSLAAVVTAAISLARPALQASAEGVLEGGFSATWVMVGAESAAGWLPLAASVALFASIRSYRTGSPARAWGSMLAASIVALAAFPFLLDTTLHTWNRWVPAAVQQTYGTEYARFSASGIIEPIRMISIALVALASAVLLVAVLTRGRDTLATSEEMQ